MITAYLFSWHIGFITSLVYQGSCPFFWGRALGKRLLFKYTPSVSNPVTLKENGIYIVYMHVLRKTKAVRKIQQHNKVTQLYSNSKVPSV